MAGIAKKNNMRTKFEFPPEIKKLLSEEKIDMKKIKDLISENYLAEDLDSLDKKGIKFKEILIKINGVKMYNSKRVYIKPREMGKKEPLSIVSVSGFPELNIFSLSYIVYKNN